MIKKQIKNSTFYTDYENQYSFKEGQIYFGKKNVFNNETSVETQVIFYIHKINKKSTWVSILCEDQCVNENNIYNANYTSTRYDFNEKQLKAKLQYGGYGYPDCIQLLVFNNFVCSPLKAYRRNWWQGADDKEE